MTILKKSWERLCAIMAYADEWALDMLYPPRCPFCDKVTEKSEPICPSCRKKIHPTGDTVCMRCGKPLSDKRAEFCMDCAKHKHHFIQGKAVWVYEKPVPESIYRFKYQNKREYGRAYAKEMAERYGTWIRTKQIQAVVPVPLHKNRKRKRGYNQAEIIAEELGKILGLPVYTDLLARVRDTMPQKMLNQTERKNNLKKAFKTTESSVQLQYILIVDDIYTTGSTLDAAAAALIEAGSKGVYTCCVSMGRGY